MKTVLVNKENKKVDRMKIKTIDADSGREEEKKNHSIRVNEVVWSRQKYCVFGTLLHNEDTFNRQIS